MHLNHFLSLVEIKTKVASVIPFLVGTLFVLLKYETFNPLNALLMFLSLFIFDMTTTAINNYMDYHKALKKEGYGYEKHNAIVYYHLNPKTVRLVIYIMFSLATLLGIWLWLRTDLVVLLIGVLSFLIGIAYSFGPIPISRTPLGEFASGVTMGGLIPLLASYIHIYPLNVISIGFSDTTLALSVDLHYIFSIVLVSFPLMVGIANIMLANNLCDLEEDRANRRYTLPIYIGKEQGLRLYHLLYYIGFGTLILSCLLGVLPPVSLLTLLVFFPIRKHITQFKLLQTKKDTFILSVKNFLLLGLSTNLTLLLAYLLKFK